jgi:hypothetical protein
MAVVLLLTAVYCATRPVTSRLLGRRFEADVDAMHVVMGWAMAAMLVGRLGAEWSRAVVIVCLAGVAWFGSRTVRDGMRARAGGAGPGHQAQHLVACTAMLYMLRGASAGGMTGMSGAAGTAAGRGLTGLSVRYGPAGPSMPIEILAVTVGAVLIAYAACDVFSLAASPRPSGTMITSTGTRPLLAPRVAVGCQAVMGFAMGGMMLATV